MKLKSAEDQRVQWLLNKVYIWTCFGWNGSILMEKDMAHWNDEIDYKYVTCGSRKTQIQ